jgi:aspartate 1-decarboxylase
MYGKERMLSKIHNCVVTQANLEYEGSITIGRDLLKLTWMDARDKVQVLDKENVARIETYVIEGEESEICLNGAAANLFNVGDRIIIIQYGLQIMGVQKVVIEETRATDDFPKERIVVCDGTPANSIKEVK